MNPNMLNEEVLKQSQTILSEMMKAKEETPKHPMLGKYILGLDSDEWSIWFGKLIFINNNEVVLENVRQFRGKQNLAKIASMGIEENFELSPYLPSVRVYLAQIIECTDISIASFKNHK